MPIHPGGKDTGTTSLQGNRQCPANFYTYKCFAPAILPLEERWGAWLHTPVGRRTYRDTMEALVLVAGDWK